MRCLARLAVLAVLALVGEGCLSSAVLDARVAEAQASAEALETIADIEVARAGFQAQLAELEGLHRMAPGSDDALFALLRGWTVYGAVFLADAREEAVDAGDLAATRALTDRELHALERAIGFGLHALARRGGDLPAARRTREDFAQWADARLTRARDGELAYWVGRAYRVRERLVAGEPGARRLEPFVGAVLLERSHRLAPGYARYGALRELSLALGETSSGAEEARRDFELVLARTGRRALSVHVEYALGLACRRPDAALTERLLTEVLASTDPGLEDRLANAFAKRRARRALARPLEHRCASAAPPAYPAPRFDARLGE